MKTNNLQRAYMSRHGWSQLPTIFASWNTMMEPIGTPNKYFRHLTTGAYYQLSVMSEREKITQFRTSGEYQEITITKS